MGKWCDHSLQFSKGSQLSQYKYLLPLLGHSVVSDSVTPWTAAYQAYLCFIVSWSLVKLMPSKLVMPSNHLIFYHLLLLLPSIFPRLRVFSSDSALPIRWPWYCSFSFNISPSNEYSGLSSFTIDCFYLLAVQWTLRNLF